MLRGQALIWWERVRQTLGDDAKVNMTWDEFVNQIKVKYYATHDIEKIVDEFFDLKKGHLSVEEYAKESSQIECCLLGLSSRQREVVLAKL